MLAAKNTLPKMWFGLKGNLINRSIERCLAGNARGRGRSYALINEHSDPAEHRGQERSSTVSTDIKTYDNKTPKAVVVGTDINIKQRDQSCTSVSNFAFTVKKKARRQPCPLPDQGHQGAQRSLEAVRNSLRLKAYPQSTARSIT